MQLRTHHHELTARWCASAAAIATLITFTVTGNSAVLLALRRMRRAPSDYPLASLALADLLLGLLVLPMAATRELFVLQLHWLTCTCWETLDVFCCTASILSLCTLGWERWCGITAPLARARRAKRSKLFACLVWPVSVAVALPTGFIYTPRHHLGESDMACPDNMNVSYIFASVTVSFYLPAAIMLVLYARILCALAVTPNIRAHRGRSLCLPMSPIGKPDKNATSACSTPKPKNNAEAEQKTDILLPSNGQILSEVTKEVQYTVPFKKKTIELKRSLSVFSRQRRATRTIVRLMALFLVCWTPFFVMLPLDALCDCVWDPIWQCFTWLGYTNSALNPLVYAAASPSVRRALHASFSTSSRPTDTQMTPTRKC